MRRGCISMGEVHCDKCHRVIPPAQRYLTIDEIDGVEAEGGKMVRHCIECALEKGYAIYKDEKGGRILTFLP